MFKNLRSEMVKAELSIADLAQIIGVSYNTLTAKLKGRTDWKITEMTAIQNAINTRTGEYSTIDELFIK